MRVLILLFFISCIHATQGQTPNHILENYRLHWNDEFEGVSIDTLKWKYRDTGKLRKKGVVFEENCFVDGKGHLIIGVTKVDSTYRIGQIGSQNTFQTKYGYFECRAKMNQQLGPHIAFWLQSPTIHQEHDNPGDFGTEIDVFEYHIAEGLDYVYHNLHWNGYKKKHKSTGTRVLVDDVHNGFHTFALEWTEQEYIFYVDGIETWRTKEAVSHIAEYMILSAELTGWGGDCEKADFPDQVIFDYVRVYKKSK
ncbi:glycoside hydrolase family 16 protein [Carboxylicivirga sp. N1Y90]|uniref:glycoside hydrolase family 16 protein n=1 Tax=Carboxylicivirga fragile TaxID=3417571 RepID=UPI003D356D8E|nr:glycoside hydrolase family 16 protein [Marinilabiliaceae bacterium N1Y90]